MTELTAYCTGCDREFLPSKGHECPNAKQRRAEVNRRRWSEIGPERGTRVRKKREPEANTGKPDLVGHGDSSNALPVADL
jgi:hypothetical protein